MEEERKLKQQIALMQDEHRNLDVKISANNLNPMEKQRYKKQKLMLKDEIARLSSFLYPDIIA